MTIDSHLHVWDPTRLRYPWLDFEADLNAPFLPSDVETGRVKGFVFVQADALDGLAEADWVQSLDWPQLHGIVAFAPIENRVALGPALDRLSELPSFAGVRRLLQDEPRGFISSEDVIHGLRELGGRGIPFDVCVRHWQLDEVVRTATATPQTTLILDHLGKPPIAAGLDSAEGQAWLANIKALAILPNTHVKISGLAPEARPELPLDPQLTPFVLSAADAFGVHRVVFGSDFPVSAATKHRLGYEEWFDFVDQTLALEGRERDLLFHSNAAALYQPHPR